MGKAGHRRGTRPRALIAASTALVMLVGNAAARKAFGSATERGPFRSQSVVACRRSRCLTWRISQLNARFAVIVSLAWSLSCRQREGLRRAAAASQAIPRWSSAVVAPDDEVPEAPAISQSVQSVVSALHIRPFVRVPGLQASSRQHSQKPRSFAGLRGVFVSAPGHLDAVSEFPGSDRPPRVLRGDKW
jgi:hypothetical protein